MHLKLNLLYNNFDIDINDLKLEIDVCYITENIAWQYFNLSCQMLLK